MPVQHESELYEPVKVYFESLGYEVRAEVNHCDLVAVRKEDEPVIVELKKTFNLPLLIQGITRLQTTEQVYLAVEIPHSGKAPYSLKWRDIHKLCRMLGLGLLTVRFYKTRAPRVELACAPETYQPKIIKHKASRLLIEFNERSGDYNIGGSTKVKQVTAYREKALYCAYLIHEHGPLSPRELKRYTGNEKAPLLLQNNYYGWFERIKRGIYGLTPEGEHALREYSHVLKGMLRNFGNLRE